MKVKVMGLNPGYLLKSFLLYIKLDGVKYFDREKGPHDLD